MTDPDKPANVPEEGGDAPSNSRPAGKSPVDPLEAQNARIAEFHELGAVGVSKGQLTGPTKAVNELKAAERSFVDEQLKLGKDVEVIPRAETTGPNVPRGENRTPDFKIDGVVNELKTVSGIQKQTSDALSSGIASRIIDGRGQAPNIIVDARLQSGLTKEIAERAIIRAYGADKVKKGIQSIRIIGPNFDITVLRI
ncbi:MAG: hypothetical protein JNL58_27945 [Planctomyces sp.]|nr:hypothetical protein [Planctomyces sp.]